MEENTQVRVDNWGVFFLQRLQLFFNKTDYCDLTLQFQGNVQLKVHKLVLNACTEYFELLENSDRLIGDNLILMPDTLQADVVVPIINFMYTGMLEYPPVIYNRLCQAAELMHISVLNKLLAAQKPSLNKSERIVKPKMKEFKSDLSSNSFSQLKKATPKLASSDFSPGTTTFNAKKSTSWKRKPTVASGNSSFSLRSESIRSNDPLALDEAKPTRFEWPEDDLDLPNLDMMDISGFGDISYNSKPLLREDEVKPNLTKDENQRKQDTIHEMQLDDKSNHESPRNGAEKRKAESGIEKSPKRVKIVETENETTISVISNEGSAGVDPTKIISEILKKYPHLVKKKKNIKLKIVAKQNERETKSYIPAEKSVEKVSSLPIVRKTTVYKPEPPKTAAKDTVWSCKECSPLGNPAEFMLYYLYRKHMTDVHGTKFDPRICKYCGIAFLKNDRQSYHLFTKHGIKPSGNQVFPSCPFCPYIAISKEDLQFHKNKHKKSEMQCTCCKLGFISPEAISSHIQITGHMGKTNKLVYDCQYCPKTLQSAITLLTHIKTNHEIEGKRDGIVSLDEVGMEEGDSLNEQTEEAASQNNIVPEVQKNKVKIISDVTVPVSKSKPIESETIDQTKSHVSVPTSIATSLGLLDIVVLDDNQQFILHNQSQQTGNNQAEYILPQIDTRNVTAEGLSSNDDLVMVLTDQDYKDGHSGITTDNSNIVVLYSHPADGQQGQFITSQGNLMVNSETGLLEIRNGAAIATTSANQIVMSAPSENHIETIEMIQREIAGGQEIKQEEFYGDHKSKVLEQSQNPVHYIENSQVEEQGQQSTQEEVVDNDNMQIEECRKPQNDENLVEKVSSGSLPLLDESLEEQSSSGVVDESPANTEAIDESFGGEISEQNISESKDSVAMQTEDSCLHEESTSMSREESTSESREECTLVSREECTSVSREESTTVSREESTTVSREESTSVPREESSSVSREEIPSSEIEEGPILESENMNITFSSENTDEQEKNCEEKPEDIQFIKNEQVDEHVVSAEALEQFDGNRDLPMEIDEAAVQSAKELDNSSEYENKDEETVKLENVEETEDLEMKSEKDEEKPYSPTDNPVDMECEAGQELNEKQDTESLNENSLEITQSDKDGDIQESRVSSQASQVEEEEQDKQSEGTKESTTMSILDDWEDTDSQQSDNKIKSVKKGAQEAVHKLMDDWDEEEIEK